MNEIVFEFQYNGNDETVNIDIELHHRYGSLIEKSSIIAKINDITAKLMKISVAEATLDLIKDEKIVHILSFKNFKMWLKYFNKFFNDTIFIIMIFIFVVYLIIFCFYEIISTLIIQ